MAKKGIKGASSNNPIMNIAKEFISENTDELVDIITFCEAQWGLNLNLFPAQRFILKCIYGIELDDTDPYIPIPDLLNEKILYTLTETQFLQFLYDEGRCNTSETDGKTFQEIVLVLGRRSSKSALSSFISNYEIYKLIKRRDPAKFHGLNTGDEIAILNVAPTDEQAGVVFRMIKQNAFRSPYLRGRILNETMLYFRAQTDVDREIDQDFASIISLVGGCSSNSLRGNNAIMIILDEMAFFIDKESSRFSGSEVYSALVPSMSSFGKHGKVLCLSSPYAKFGMFYKRFQQSFEEPDYTLMFKMPTAMVNPTVESNILKASYRRNRSSFMCEYGGEFSDRITAWVEDESEFTKNISDREPPSKGVPDVNYYMGIDLGFKNDGTAICIVHKENGVFVLDYAQVWFSGSSDVWERESSMYHNCTKYNNQEFLKMADIVNEIKELVRWFPTRKAIFDQHEGYGLHELLVAEGLTQFEMKQFSAQTNHDVYELSQRLYGEQLLDIFNDPVLIPELLSLEAERKGGKNGKIDVHAPNMEGAHDDISDAFVRAIYCCYHATGTNQSKSRVMGSGRSRPTGKLGLTRNQAMLEKRKNHGPHPRGIDKISRPKNSHFGGRR